MKSNYCRSPHKQSAGLSNRWLRFLEVKSFAFALTLSISVAIFEASAQNFSDDFTRATNTVNVLPWQVQIGNWAITNGVFLGGPNPLDTYGNAYTTNNLTNFTVRADFAFGTNAFGGGLGARLNPASGAHYAAWIYPEGSAGGSRVLKLIKFSNWTTFTQLGSSVSLPFVGTNSHQVTMVLDTNFISVYFDGALQISFLDSPTSYHTNGGVSVDMFTLTPNPYVLTVDNVSATPINYPPTSTSDFFTLASVGTQTVTAPGVLYNDPDPDTVNLTALLVGPTTNGVLVLSNTGAFSYTLTNAAANYDSFTYRCTDGNSTSAVATVLITLTSQGAFFSDNFNRATNPASLLPWTNHSGNWAITNDVMAGGTNSLFSYATAFTGGDWIDYSVQGSFLFPMDGYGGGVAGRLNPATGHRYAAWLYPELSDRGPNNIRIVKFQSWNTYGYNGVVGNNVKAIAEIHLDSAVFTNTWHTLKLAFQTNLLSVYFDGQWLTNVGDFDIYTNSYPSGGISLDFFTLTNTYMIHAEDVVARPLVSDDSYVTTEETLLTVTGTGVLTNDTGITGIALTSVLIGAPANGSLSLSTNGSFTYTPANNFSGSDSFTYETRQGTNSLGAAIVHITVNAANNNPPVFVATPSNTSIAEGSMLTVTNAATDGDLPANTLSYTLVSAPVGASISTNGVISWTPNEAQGPSTNVIATAVSDGVVSVTNSFAVIVTEVNVAPLLPAQTNHTVAELTLLTVINTASDSDIPANTLTYSLLVAPTNAAISGSGVITWMPSEAQGPSTNVFTTVVNDGVASATNSFSVVVTEVNLAPMATNDSYFLTNTVLTVAANGILANDADADLPANTLTTVLVSSPTNGVLNLSSNGGFTYTPNVGFSGLDAFTYRANDGIANSAVATVSITVSNRPFVITSVAVNSGLATVTWNSALGLSYRVQYLSNLNSTNWTDVNPVVTATNISASVTNFVGSDPQRFYRVKVTEAPLPVILSLQVTNGTAVITWSSVPAKAYRLQYKANVTDVAWTEVTPSITAIAATTTTTNVVGTAAQRFFRIHQMP